MAIDHNRIHTKVERARARYRCPECNTPLALTWRRARQPGRSEDLYTNNKASCPNHCNYDPDEV
jgi:hypothetical protein